MQVGPAAKRKTAKGDSFLSWLFQFVKKVLFYLLHRQILLFKGFPLRGSWRRSRLMRWR